MQPITPMQKNIEKVMDVVVKLLKRGVPVEVICGRLKYRWTFELGPLKIRRWAMPKIDDET